MKNLVMNIVRYLGATPSSGADMEGLKGIGDQIYGTFYNILKIILPIIFGVITLIGVVYCITLGVNYAKQESTDKREEAKKRLVGAVIGFGIAIVGSAALWALFGLGVFDSLFV